MKWREWLGLALFFIAVGFTTWSLVTYCSAVAETTFRWQHEWHFSGQPEMLRPFGDYWYAIPTVAIDFLAGIYCVVVFRDRFSSISKTRGKVLLSLFVSVLLFMAVMSRVIGGDTFGLPSTAFGKYSPENREILCRVFFDEHLSVDDKKNVNDILFKDIHEKYMGWMGTVVIWVYNDSAQHHWLQMGVDWFSIYQAGSWASNDEENLIPFLPYLLQQGLMQVGGQCYYETEGACYCWRWPQTHDAEFAIFITGEDSAQQGWAKDAFHACILRYPFDACIACHEMSHMIGLPHCSASGCIMNDHPSGIYDSQHPWCSSCQSQVLQLIDNLD